MERLEKLKFKSLKNNISFDHEFAKLIIRMVLLYKVRRKVRNGNDEVGKSDEYLNFDQTWAYTYTFGEALI